MATVTITYTPAVTFEKDIDTQQIFSVWNPAATASDNTEFENTYYNTNVWDDGEFKPATSLEEFLAAQVAHPGLVAALRAAVKAYETAKKTDPDATSGTYPWVTTDDNALYAGELESALESQGFTLSAGGGSEG